MFDQTGASAAEVKQAFDVFDVNGDGFIDVEELQRVMCVLRFKEVEGIENCEKMIRFGSQLISKDLRDRVSGDEEIGIGFGRRALLSFKETPQGSNVTFECSRSGPCVACLYSEKNDEKYRCSETGYRIPLKCVEIKDTSKVSNEKKSHNGRSMLDISYEHKVVPDDASGHASSTAHRNLRDGSVSSTDGPQSYITYRSCIPSVNEEKLSVLGFEGIVLCLLLISGSVVYFRRKRSISMAGFASGRVQSNSRF
ncbi:uncharacterized protein E6C27_scaffold65G003690 [Cucumis melo var. makuwa]|nr:uncharacterized protein E6C27_scaffold65G003690 [Cucumis melo var. makuwa]